AFSCTYCQGQPPAHEPLCPRVCSAARFLSPCSSWLLLPACCCHPLPYGLVPNGSTHPPKHCYRNVSPRTALPCGQPLGSCCLGEWPPLFRPPSYLRPTSLPQRPAPSTVPSRGAERSPWD